jgi:ABC-2 type transport system ATP-binding protein
LPSLTINALRKRFGSIEAVTDASFTVNGGEVLGLLGPNGAGKSTILACLAGLLPADDGRVEIDGRHVPAERRREVLFYLPDGIAPWPDQRVGWVLDFHTALVGGGEWRGAAAAALAITGFVDRRMGALSKGQRKRVLLVLALATPQPIVLMDEPFDGLDLRQTREAIALFRDVAAGGRSLVLSIHAMADAARVCDRLVLVSDGRTVAEGSLGGLRDRAGLAGASSLEDVFLALA